MKKIRILMVYVGGDAVGEGAALYALSRDLDKRRFEICFVQLFKGQRRGCQVRLQKLFKGERVIRLFNKLDKNGPHFNKIKKFSPEILVFGCIQSAGNAVPGKKKIALYDRTRIMLEECIAPSTQVVIYDPNDDTVRQKLIDSRPMLTIHPRPIRFYPAKRLPPSAIEFKLNQPKRHVRFPKRSAKYRVLWVGTWCWQDNLQELYFELEAVTLNALLEICDLEIWTTIPLTNASERVSQRVKVIDDSFDQSYEGFNGIVKNMDFVVCLHGSSALATRAAILGVPVILVQPPIPKKYREEGLPVPNEFLAIELDSERSAKAAFKKIVSSLKFLKSRQRNRIKKYQGLRSTQALFEELALRLSSKTPKL